MNYSFCCLFKVFIRWLCGKTLFPVCFVSAMYYYHYYYETPPCTRLCYMWYSSLEQYIYIHTFISNLWRFLYSSFRIQLKLFQTTVFTTSGKMIIPIRCFTCGKVMFVTSGWYSGLYSIGPKTSETYIFPPSKLHLNFSPRTRFFFILQFLYIFYGTL